MNETDNQEYRDWCQELKDWQESDRDQRDQAREADRFLLDKDGQWEDIIAQTLDSQRRPRYTFDKVTPVIETMMADIEDMDFGCNVKPGESGDKDVALTLEGMIRSIQNMSKADSIFRNSTRRVMRRGFDAWIVKAKYKDDWCFDQDLFIHAIPNAVNRVWTSNTIQEQSSSDSPASYVLTSLSKAEYDKRYPDGSGVSVDNYDLNEFEDNYQPEVVTIGERYYKKETEIEIAQLSNGEVVELNEKFEAVKDEYELAGVMISKTKKIKDYKWYYRQFDGKGFLSDEMETPFRSNPVITVYGNFEHLGESSKITYSGIVLKEMDAQRVHNYAKSREIEEGALAPRSKWWMTKKQAAGHEDQIARMNISADPVQFFNPDPENPTPPTYGGGPQINPHLNTLAAQMEQDINNQANVFSAMQGNIAARQSEDSIRMQIDRGTASTRKWVNAIIDGIRQTCEVLVETIPVVYDTKRVFYITNMDGTEDEVVLNNEVYDRQSQQVIKINDLNKGKYKVVCDAGPAFSNKLEAGLSALLEYAAIDPSVVAQAGDVMLKSIDAPLVDQIADRKRALMVQQGLIPIEQMTDEEKQKVAMQMQAQAGKPNVNEQLAMAEGQARIMEGQAAVQNEINDANKIQVDAINAETKRMELQVKAAEAGVKMENVQADTAKKLSEIDKNNADTASKRIDSLQKTLGNADAVIIQQG